MTDIAIKNQIEALRITTKEALKSKEASLQLLINLRLVSNRTARQSQSRTDAKSIRKIKTS
jgi:hypothetical protein